MRNSCSRFLALAAACAVLPLSTPAQAQLPDFGKLIDGAKGVKKFGDSFRKIAEPEEIMLGRDLAGIILGAAPLLKDPAKQAYVNRLGRWIALHSERPDLPWKFGVVDSDDVNAFSMPGGYVLITRGMLSRMRSESELAGVLAHEVAHVVERHQLGALQKSLRNSAVSDVNQYFNSGGGLKSVFTTALVNAGKDLFSKGLDKDDEFAADRMGVVIAARSGYSPYGLVGVLQTLSAAPEEKGFALMNKTHPLPVSRMEKLDSAMGTQMDALSGLVEDAPTFAAAMRPAAPAATRPAKPKRKSRN